MSSNSSHEEEGTGTASPDISFDWFKRPLPPPLIPTQQQLDQLTAKARKQDASFGYNYCPDLSLAMFRVSQWEDYVAGRVSVPIIHYDRKPRIQRYPSLSGEQFGVIDESQLSFAEKRNLQLVDVMCHEYEKRVEEEKERIHRKKMDELRKKHGVI